MRKIKQSAAANLMVLLVQSADHVTGLAGATLAITESKDGGAFGATSPTVTDRGNGWYNIALVAGDTGTLGQLALHITATSADPIDLSLEVVAYDPADSAALGLSRVDAAVSTRATQAQILSDASPFQGVRIDAAISSRSTLTQAQVLSDTTPFAGASVALIKAKTDNLPASPAAVGSAMTLTSAYDPSKTASQAGDAMTLTNAAMDAIMDRAAEGSLTFRQLFRIVLAFVAGKASGAPTGPIAFRDQADTKNRIAQTVDATGNRTSVSVDGT